MRFSVIRCDDCGKDEWLIFPKKYPEGWTRKHITSSETWDLCRSCQQDVVRGSTPKREGEKNKQVVERLLEANPKYTDQQIAEEAALWGCQMAGETVRRHRVSMGIPDSRKRRRETVIATSTRKGPKVPGL